MAGQVVVLEDAQPCRSGQALRPDWQCGRGAGWGAQACQPQTGDLDLHCLAQDVHPACHQPASLPTPRLAKGRAGTSRVPLKCCC